MADGTVDTAEMAKNVEEAVRFLKALSNSKRMLILCHLVNCERNVMELGMLLDIRQPSISQELSRLRRNGMVATRRDAKHVYYRIADPKVEEVIATMHRLFCAS